MQHFFPPFVACVKKVLQRSKKNTRRSRTAVKIPKSVATSKLQRLKAKAASQHYGGTYRKSGNTNSSSSNNSNNNSNGVSGSVVGSGSDLNQFATTGGYNYQRGGAAEERNYAATAATSSLALASAATETVGEKSYHYNNNNNNTNSNNNYQKSNYTSANYNNNQQQQSTTTNHLPYQHTQYTNNNSNNISGGNGNGTAMMMTKQKSTPTLNERLNIGDEVRELKLGATFNPKNTSTAFHTIKCECSAACPTPLSLILSIYRLTDD